ncbi:MAG: hypothetical protein MK108_14190 [Mariniblastus sp.]|nr:hypothetical protein [Mariniblastus sp.]
MKRLFLSAMAIFLLPLPLGYGSIGLVIDDFDVGNSGAVPQSFSSVGTYPVFTSTDASIFGGVRKWQVDVTAHMFSDTEVYDGVVGLFGIANGVGQHGLVSIRWDGQDNDTMAGQFPNVDLTESGVNEAFHLDLDFADLPTVFGLTVSDSVSSIEVTRTLSGAVVSEYRFSEFAGIDFTDVQSIQLNVHGQQAYDVQIDSLTVGQAVPEPLSALIWAPLWAICLVRRVR